MSEAQGHRPIQELLFVSSGPALTNRWAGGTLQRGLCAQFLCAEPVGVPAKMGPVPREGSSHVSPVGCWVPAHESPVRCKGHVNERPLRFFPENIGRGGIQATEQTACSGCYCGEVGA